MAASVGGKRFSVRVGLRNNFPVGGEVRGGQLKSLGYSDVRVYNGGWSDWDRSLTLPVVKGSKPFDADFEL